MATIHHCTYCFDSILEDLTGTTVKEPIFENASYPLFVTWNILYSADYQLRGCIGNFNPMNLKQGLYQYAKISAFQDSRFHPISLKELPNLKCSVSLLTNFERANDWNDWEIGKHGIRISFNDPKTARALSGTYLPEVAVSQDWDQRDTIESLVKKAGYNGKVGDNILSSMTVTRYQSSKAHATYQDYITLSN